jgi:hypothetical protein
MYTPRAHQIEGMDFHRASQFMGSLIWHGMGLGKSSLALWLAEEHIGRLKKLGVKTPKFVVFCPKSALPTWRAECRKFTPSLYRDMILFPYSQMNKAIRMVDYIDARMITFDESHYLKSPSTNRVKGLSEFLRRMGKMSGRFEHGRMLFLTGTPMPNNAAEIYSTWAIATAPNVTTAADRLIDEVKFDLWRNTYTRVEVKTWKIGKNKSPENQRRGVAKTFQGVDNSEQFAQLIGPITHFKRVEDCIDLPEKQEVMVDLGLPDDKLLANASLEQPEAYMALLERLSRAKTPHMIEWVKDFLEGTQEQLVVFATHVFALRALQDAFPNHVKLIIGELSTGERTRHLTEFQNSKFRVLALSYQCGSESLNLQNASKALYLGYPWTDGKLKQAMARIYRQGQKNATMHYFLTSGECDQRILRLVRTKEEATNTVENLLLSQEIKQTLPKETFSIDDLI